MERREFIKTTGCGTVASIVLPSVFNLYGGNRGEEFFSDNSALNTRLSVKFLIHGIIHEDAWEGSCRTGKLENLTCEFEKAGLDKRYEDFKKGIDKMKLFPELEILEPVKSYIWVEKGNPELMYPEENIIQLAADDLKTDVYVIIGGGKYGLAGLKIAENFRKPVILANVDGCGVALPAALRNLGYESYYAKNNDQLKEILNLLFVRKAITKTKLMIVTNSPNSLDRIAASKSIDLGFLRDKYGMDYQYVNYDEFFKGMDELMKDENSTEMVHKLSNTLLKGASGSNMNLDNIISSVWFYFTARHFLEKYSCNAFTVDCFELCPSMHPWNRKFTPCLCNALLKDAGYPAACEADISAHIAMTILMYLSRKAVYLGNPQVDTVKNTLRVNHSVASLKMTGFDKPETKYSIEAFTRSGFGVTLRHDFKENLYQDMTVGRFSPSGKGMLLTKGTIIDGNIIGCACSQSVTLKIPDGNDFLEKQQNYGHHLSLVYGDYCKQIAELGKIMGFEVEAVI